MNYYEHHLGDWAAATAHLSWDEDMAYTRLLRAYYHTEQPIPEGQQYRLARATTPAQKRAVDAVLREFFRLVEGAYRQKRADDEISRYQDKRNKASASAKVRWNQPEPKASAIRTHTDEGNANASPNAMRTHSGGNALQSPDTRHQSPDPYTQIPDSGVAGEVPRETFAKIRASYPPGTYRDNTWLHAERAIAQLLEQGETIADLVSAAAAYGIQQQAMGKSGTQFVLSPAKFFGPDEHWRGPFPLPKSKSESQQDANLAVGQRFLQAVT